MQNCNFLGIQLPPVLDEYQQLPSVSKVMQSSLLLCLEFLSHVTTLIYVRFMLPEKERRSCRLFFPMIQTIIFRGTSSARLSMCHLSYSLRYSTRHLTAFIIHSQR